MIKVTDDRYKSQNSWRARNPEKVKQIRLKWTEKNKRRLFAQHLQKRYGFDIDQYDLLIQNSGGKCEICLKDSDLMLDHCHETNRIRGLLCHQCNIGLGAFKDTPGFLKRAAKYVASK